MNLLRRLAILLVATVVGFVAPISTYALSEEQIHYNAQNGIYFYESDGQNITCHASTVPVSGDQVTVIGDSLSVRATGEYASQIPGADYASKTYDGVKYYLVQVSKKFKSRTTYNGESNYSGLEIVRALKEHGDLRPYVVFALGTNDAGGTKEEKEKWIKELVDLVGPSHKIVLMTNYALNNKQNYSANNEAIMEAAKKYNNVAVADWAEEVGKDPTAYINDTEYYVHQNEAGSKLLVKLIKKALDSFATAYEDGPIVIAGATIEEKIWTGLTSFMTAEQAAGVMGNMYWESRLNPAQHENGFPEKYPDLDLGTRPGLSYGIGLIQWSYDRRVAFYRYMQSAADSLMVYLDTPKVYSIGVNDGNKFLSIAGDDATDRLLSYEIKFMKDELDNKFSGLYSTYTVYDAAQFFLERVERPTNPKIENYPERVTSAEKFYERLKDYMGGACAETKGDSLTRYVKLYVWPEYHDPQFLERKTAYAEAVSNRSSRSLWVGGSVGGVAGIDCGGFVTTILNESGFDPNYNYGGNGSAINEPKGQLAYIREHQDEWKMVNKNVGVAISDESALSPGDVAFSDCEGGSLEKLRCGHTYLYIGEVDGFETHIASASYSYDGNGGRAPMSGQEYIVNDGVVWFHKVK